MTRPTTRVLRLSLLLPTLALLTLGADCRPSGRPTVTLALNDVPPEMSGLLVVPPSGFLVRIGFAPGDAPIDPSSFTIWDVRWGGSTTSGLEAWADPEPGGAVLLFPPERALEPGTHTLTASVRDVQGRTGSRSISFAVRDFPDGMPPIGQGQQIWLDFEADRDAVPGSDFAVDLEHFGLGSPAAPALSALARAHVVAAVLERVREAYGQDDDGLGPDAVAVTFTDQPPASGDVTRICVGGDDPSGGTSVGGILIDPNNANRNSVECGTIPPTGVFPRALLAYRNQSAFRAVFDALRPEAGGTPFGASPWDLFVLEPGFDPERAPPEAADRPAVVTTAIEVFGDALGSVVAHEVGHALGLVPPGPPGGGLYGGSDGPAYTHAVNPDGSTPSENFLMKAGNTFSFARLAGLGYYALPTFRPIELAYLHDRLVLAPQVTQLLPPPVLLQVTPWQIVGSSQVVTLIGEGFAPVPAVRLINATYGYSAVGEAWQSPQQMTCWVIASQLPPGIYDVELTNPDGQRAVLPAAIQR